MPGEMRLTSSWRSLGVALQYATLVKVELVSKHARRQINASPPARGGGRAAGAGHQSVRDRSGQALSTRGLMPRFHSTKPGKYVAGAYGVFVVLILVYVAIMASKLQRIERELASLTQMVERPPGGRR